MSAATARGTAYRLVVGGASLIVFLAVWEWAGRDQDFGLSIRPPSVLVQQLGKPGVLPSLAEDVRISTMRVVWGFVVAALVGVPIGVWAGTTRFGRAALAPFVTILRPLPSMSWIPLSIIWFGSSELQKEYIVFMGSLPPILVYTIAAMRDLDPLLMRAARNLGAGPFALVLQVVIPSALPSILAGLRVAFAVAWTCVISAELVLTNSGLGHLIMETRETGNLNMTYIGMVAIVLVVMVLTYSLELFEWWIMPWRRGGQPA